MQKLTAVVVGTGFIGPVHVEALRRAGIEIRGIVGSTPEKSRATASNLGLPRGYESLSVVLADDEVDIVHLATPNHLHFEQAQAVLKAGKHVLCEKPLAMNSHESAELVRLAAESGRAAGVAYNIRFYPLCHEARDQIAAGSLGDVLHVTGSYVQDWLLLDTDYNWRVSAVDGGELRAVADIGTHWLDLMQFITGREIVSVCADLQTVHSERRRPTGGVETFSGKGAKIGETEPIAIDTEDAGCIMLRFDNGAHGSLWVSQTTAGRKNCLRYELAGSKKALAWNSETPNELWIGHRDRSNEVLIRDPSLLSDSAARIADYPGGHNEGFPDSFKQLFSRFAAYVRAGDFGASAPFPTFQDGHREILLCEAILASHRQRRWVDLPSPR
ncbi:MAG: Gfo/Idh/MocA family oxidoreductase [Pirellulales bacterium]